MASRMKEDERNERIIRGLLKLPANKRCINCNNLGPQYVCTNFWTFVCTNCSGLHREFCHRVKSISMAKFTAQEVSALQEGGNEKAKEIYFKEWDPQHNSLPDSSNIDKLRDFIKHVYVDRRYTGEKNADRPVRADRDVSNERRGASYGGDSRSPSYDDRSSERFGPGGRSSDRNIRYVYGERSPGYDQSDKKSPRRFEVVDDRVRDDRFGIRRFEDRRLPDMANKPEGSSPSHQKSVPSPPVVRPVRDILGDDAPQLHVGDTPKSSSSGVPDSSAPTQRTSSSSSVVSTDTNSVQFCGSLIDFTDDPGPPVAAETKQPSPQPSIAPSQGGGDWASFDNAGQQKAPAPQPAASSGTLESALSQLSAPGPHTPQVSTLPGSGVGAYPKTNDIGQPATTHQHPSSLFPADFSQAIAPSQNAPVASVQLWGSSAVQNTQGSLSITGAHLSQVASKSPQGLSAGVSSQPAAVEANPIGRKELPADLFTGFYNPIPAAVPGWYRGPYPGTGYGIQYPMGMPQPMPTIPHPTKSTNPFDVGGEPALAHAPTFPSMSTLQGALPPVPGPSPLLRSSSLGNPSQWASPQHHSLQSAMPYGQHMMQQVPGNMPQLLQNNMAVMGHQGAGGPRSQASPLGNLGMDGRYSVPNAPFSSTGGNPFG